MKNRYRIQLFFSYIILISLLDCEYITAQTPGGISTGLQVWLKANAGTTTVGTTLTGWQDQSTAATAINVNGSPQYTNPGYNYNPYITFTMSNGLGGDFLHIADHNFQSFFWVSQLTTLTRPSTHLATYNAVTLGQPCNGCPIHGGANGGTVAEYEEFGYGSGNFQTAGVWRKNGTATGIAYNTPHSGNFDIVTALGGAPVPINVFMGGQNSNPPVFDGRPRDWLGPVGEIIVYSGAITAVQANKVESYLGVKYGITLGGNGSTTVYYTSPTGTTIWAANTGYHNDVAGIGNDAIIEALNQPKSHSINTPADAVIMANSNFAAPTALTDGQYLLWGHNTGTLTYTCQNFTHGGPNTTLDALWGRVWRTQKTGTPGGSVIVAIDMSLFQGPSGLGTANNTDVRFLVDDNTAFGDGSAGEHTYIPDAGYSATSGTLYFTVPYTDIQNGTGYFAMALITDSAAVTISATDTTICLGTSVTFTATPTNGGTTPSYQWQVNGVNAGTNSNTFTSTTLNNNDVVTVILTSNGTCVSPPTATSNTITMVVNPALMPSVTINTPSFNICSGASVTFTATPTNGGAAPSYQWQVNGINAGTNSNTFTSTTLNNNNVVTVILTSNAACISPATATSNAITITVNPSVIPSVTITASATAICEGTSVTFTAVPTNGGTVPNYQWQVNGTNAGTNSTTFTSAALNNNDVVTVILTSNVPCASPASIVSNSITMDVTPQPVAAFTYTSSSSSDPNLQFVNTSLNSTSWLWSFGTSSSILQNPAYTFPGDGTYWIQLTATNGMCIDTVSHVLEIVSFDTYYIPNAFSPNGDGVNDIFLMTGTGISSDNFTMSIFDRWGELVFKSNNINVGWDGTTKSNSVAEEAVYIYVINFELTGANNVGPIRKTGIVTLIQ